MSCCNNNQNCYHDPCGSSFNQSVTQAAQYAQFAQTQATLSQEAWEEFNALYLGAFAVAPTQDNEGNPLQVGALYWNTALNQLFAWNGVAWQVAANFTEFTPFLATGTTTARNLVTRMSDVVNVLDFGADPTGISDSTAAFQAACSTGKIVFAFGTFLITQQVLVYGKLIGVLGLSTLNLNVIGDTNGLALQSNATISGFTINRVRSGVVSSSGAFGNAIAVWPSAGGNLVPNLFSNITISNVNIIASGSNSNVITFLGNIKNFIIENVNISGLFLYGMLIHWRRLGSAPFDSYHPRNGVIRNITFKSDTWAQAESGLYQSATHDISASNITAINTQRGCIAAAGDIGGLFAVGESVGRVMSNLFFENIACINNSSNGFWIVGASDFQSSINNRWFMPNGGITANNITVEAGDNSTNSLEPITLEFANGVSINGSNVFVKKGREGVVNAASAVYFNSSTECFVSGVFSYPRGVRSFSSFGCQVNNSKFKHPSQISSVLSGAYGIDLDSQSFSTTTSSFVPISGTSITLSLVPCNIIPNTPFTNGGNTFYFNGFAYSGDTNTVIDILPAKNTIAIGDTIQIQFGTFDFETNFSTFTGYDRAIQSQGTSTSSVNTITVNSCYFSNSLKDHIYLSECDNADISNNYFNSGNQGSSSSASDINLRDVKSSIVKGNTFNQGLDTDSIYNVYVLNNSNGVVIIGNTFWKHQTDVITHPTASSIYLNGSGAVGENDFIIGNNWFASTVINQILPTTSRRSITIGGNRIGFATAIPTSGVWKVGDKIFNINVAIGQPKGWICTVAGEPGTWVSEGNL